MLETAPPAPRTKSVASKPNKKKGDWGHSAVDMGKKAEIIERAEEHARCLAEREKNRVAAAEAL